MNRYHFRLGCNAEATTLVKRFHYSGRVPTILVCGTLHEDGGLFGDSGPAVAACIFSNSSAKWSERIYELSRLVRIPERNVPLSSLINQTAKWCGKLYGADLLVSYADSTQGHHGGVYQAASWRYHGKRTRARDGVIFGGEFIPCRTANSTWGTNSVEKLRALGLEVEPHYDEGKYLYWRALNKNGRRKADRLGLLELPYPKPDDERNPIANATRP